MGIGPGKSDYSDGDKNDLICHQQLKIVATLKMTTSIFRASRSKTVLIELKRSIFGNMELGPVDFIFAVVFIYNTVSFISKLVRNGFKFR